MQSFRTEIENPIVEKDILDLEKKIHAFKNNKIDEEKFRNLRLARGVYGQRQQGVQMIRIKLPLGKFTAKQLLRMAEVSDDFASGNLHITSKASLGSTPAKTDAVTFLTVFPHASRSVILSLSNRAQSSGVRSKGT